MKTLRRFLFVISLFISIALAWQNGNAQDAATATLTAGGLNSATIGSNGTFTLTLGVTTNFTSVGYSVFYQSNNGSGLFQITGRTNLNPFFTMGGNPPFPMLLNPSNMFDLGYTSNQVNNPPPGTFNLQAVDFRALNAPIGTYTIFLDSRSIMVNTAFQDVNIGGPSGPVFTVNVVPEPTIVGLLAMAGVVGSILAWRKRRAAA